MISLTVKNYVRRIRKQGLKGLMNSEYNQGIVQYSDTYENMKCSPRKKGNFHWIGLPQQNL